jgi:hypothetical protein
VHRDIKPSNLLVSSPRGGKVEKGSPGIVKILDMGLALMAHAPDAPSAQWTQAGALMGTPDFIAPEQALDSHDVDIRADLYSLGCSFYYLLAGKAPFGEHSLMKKLMMHQSGDARPIEEVRPEVPAGLGMIVRKLMAKSPAERFQTPLELVDALARWSGTAPVAARPVPVANPVSVPARPMPAAETAESTLLDRSKTPSPPRSDSTFLPSLGSEVGDTSDSTLTSRPTPTTGEPELPPGTRKASKIAMLKGPRGAVASVAFSPDRSTLMAGSIDGQLFLWNMVGDTERDRSLQAHTGAIGGLAISADNRRFASSAGSLGGTIIVWDHSGADPRRRATIPMPDSSVDVLAFSGDGDLLASCGSDRRVHIWDISGTTPAVRAVLKGHGDFVRGLAFASKGQLLASTGLDGMVRIWDLNRFWSKEQAVIQGDWGQVRSVAFSRNNRTIAIGCLDQTVRLFDAATAEPTRVFRGHAGVVRRVSFNPDRKTLLSICNAGRVIRWNLETGEKEREWLLPQTKVFHGIAATHDGRYLAAGDSEGTVFIFRLYPREEEA